MEEVRERPGRIWWIGWDKLPGSRVAEIGEIKAGLSRLAWLGWLVRCRFKEPTLQKQPPTN